MMEGRKDGRTGRRSDGQTGGNRRKVCHGLR